MGKTRIIISSNSGFCFGVRRALDIAKKALKERKKVYSLGPIIHKPQVVREFQERGLKIVKGIKKAKKSQNAAFLIPSHGMSPELLNNKKVIFIDTTCPLVERVQKVVKGLKEKGYFIVIVGDKKHPEVKGLKGTAGKNSRVVKNKKEAKTLKVPANKSQRVALISQTTASVSNFKEILSEMAKKDFKELSDFNTVCRDTIAREKEARRIAGNVEAMIVIGGKQSANTSKLASACRSVNKNTRHVESGKDLKKSFFKDKKSVGIATGASTPPCAINEAVKTINEAQTYGALHLRSG